MTRYALTLTLALLACPAFAETADEKEARCNAQADIIAKAVDLRTSGKRERKATALLAAEDSGIPAKYAPAIPTLVPWVFQLPEKDLTPEAASSFKTACLAY